MSDPSLLGEIIPGWIEAVATAGALVAAGAAYSVASRTWKAQAEADVRRQADLITAWIEDNPSQQQYDSQVYVSSMGPGDSGYTSQRVVILKNASASPVWGVLVTFGVTTSETAAGTRRFAVLPPGEQKHALGRDIEMELHVLLAAGKLVIGGEPDVVAGVQFRDVQGRVWARDLRGVLALIRDPEQAKASRWWRRFGKRR